MTRKLKIFLLIITALLIAGIYLYFKYYFTYEQKNVVQRQIDTIKGQNLTVTVFGFDGRIVKRWFKVKKITSGNETRDYTYFYTQDNRYVQVPNSVWYIAEEE
jgi:hypothetical protein